MLIFRGVELFVSLSLYFFSLLLPLFCASVTSCKCAFGPFFLGAAVSLPLGGLMMGRLKHLTFLNFHNCSAERQGWDTIAIKTPLKTCFFFEAESKKLLQE